MTTLSMTTTRQDRRPALARQPEGPPPPPVVQRLRLRYAGFNPHPRISYAGAAPTGAASEAEYVEIALASRVSPEELRVALDRALPDGLDLIDAVEAAPGALADRLQASVWRVELPDVAQEDLEAAVRSLEQSERVEVSRMTKNGLRTFDARAAVVRLETTSVSTSLSSDGPGCAILQMVVRHSTPAVRPDDVLSALRVVADFAPPSPPRVTRLAQGLLDEADGSVTDPLVSDRDDGGA
jgi:radical SAM-linked protein